MGRVVENALCVDLCLLGRQPTSKRAQCRSPIGRVVTLTVLRADYSMRDAESGQSVGRTGRLL
jgi:hypothetical protein